MPLNLAMAAKQKPPSRPDADFQLSLTRALQDQLAIALDTLTPAPLTYTSLGKVQARKGIYLLLLDDKPVYVGKADTLLSERLTQHLKKISGRVGLQRGAVKFVCLYMDEDLEASAPEKLMIKWYRRKKKSDLPWNGNGFGLKDPGFERDTTRIKANHFDALYPINLDLSLSLTPGKTTAHAFLSELKRLLPYTLRFAKEPKIDLTAEFVVPAGKKDLRHWIKLVVTALPAGWLATALPGYLILSPDSDPKKYQSSILYWTKDANESAQEYPGQGAQAHPEDRGRRR